MEKGLVSALVVRATTFPPQQYFAHTLAYPNEECGRGKPYADQAKLLNGRVVRLHGLDVVGNLASDLGRGVGFEKLAQLLLLLLVVRGVAFQESEDFNRVMLYFRELTSQWDRAFP